jgi:hypothetical protein
VGEGLVAGALVACVLGVSLGAGVVFAANWDAGDRSYKAGDSNVYFAQCKLSYNVH